MIGAPPLKETPPTPKEALSGAPSPRPGPGPSSRRWLAWAGVGEALGACSWLFPQTGVLLVGSLLMRDLLLGVYLRAPFVGTLS